jgi:predicted Zn-dependent protease
MKWATLNKSQEKSACSTENLKQKYVDDVNEEEDDEFQQEPTKARKESTTTKKDRKAAFAKEDLVSGLLAKYSESLASIQRGQGAEASESLQELLREELLTSALSAGVKASPVVKGSVDVKKKADGEAEADEDDEADSETLLKKLAFGCLRNLSQLQRERGQLNEFTEASSKALNLDPSDVELWKQLGLYFVQEQRQMLVATQFFLAGLSSYIGQPRQRLSWHQFECLCHLVRVFKL